MYQYVLMKQTYSPKEFGSLVGKTTKTLQRWDREGILIAHRSVTNRRYYSHDQYLQATRQKKVSSEVQKMTDRSLWPQSLQWQRGLALKCKAALQMGSTSLPQHHFEQESSQSSHSKIHEAAESQKKG